MKSIICKILEYINKIIKSNIIKLIRASLLYNMFIMFLIIMVFLKIIFFVSPKNGSISYSGPIVNTAEIESRTIDSNFTAKNITITLASKDKVFLDWMQLLLVPTGNEPSIYIEAVGNKTFDALMFTPAGEYDGTQTNPSNLLPEPHVNITYNYWDTFINSKTGFMITGDEDTSFNLTFSGIDAYTKNEVGEVKKVDCFKTKFFKCTSESTLRFFTGYDKEIGSTIEYKISFIDFYKIRFVANSDFYVSYSFKENKFSSTMREIELQSNKEVTCDIKCKNRKINLNLYGQVKKGTIDGYSIFPSFLSWYYENVFLAPLTLISTLIGGIALMKKEAKNN